jgi:outer membrane protein assembly factor BamB
MAAIVVGAEGELFDELIRVEEHPKRDDSENWPRFRGPNGDGLSRARNLPDKWSESENIRWKTPIHDKGWSSPVIWGEQIWVTTATADGKEYFAIALERSSGKIIHDLKLFTVDKPAHCDPYNSYASPTPAVEQDRLYFHFGSYGSGCLDTNTGKTLWLRRDLPCNHHRGPGSSPVVWKNLVFLTFDGFDRQYVTALDKTTGRTVWKKDRTIQYGTDNGDYKKAYSTPSVFTINGKPQLVSPAAMATIAYQPEDGEEIWRVYHGGMNEAVQPSFGNDLIYVSSGHTPSILAVKAGQTGDLTKTGVTWRTPKGAPTRSTPVLYGELLFMVSDLGVASCLDAKTGKQIWQERVGRATCSSPILADGKLYLFDEEGRGYVVAASREYKLLATNTLDAGCMATPAIALDAIYVRTKKHLYCIGK